MNKTLKLFFLSAILFTACKNKRNETTVTIPSWPTASRTFSDSIKRKHTYLSIYSQIYEISPNRKLDLTATISIRNISAKDTLFLTKIDYYNTQGHLIRKYLSGQTFILPMETKEIIIGNADNEGGTGANFVFEWICQNNITAPLIEAVMISTVGQQGISFTSRGVDMD